MSLKVRSGYSAIRMQLIAVLLQSDAVGMMFQGLSQLGASMVVPPLSYKVMDQSDCRCFVRGILRQQCPVHAVGVPVIFAITQNERYLNPGFAVGRIMRYYLAQKLQSLTIPAFSHAL